MIVSMLLSAGAVSGGSPYVPTDAERARWTLQDMMSWKTALEAYKSDHGAYPDAADANAARAAVQPAYIAHLPMNDAWGRVYRFEKTTDGFRLISPGANGSFEPDTWTTGGKSDDFAADAVVTSSQRWWFRSWNFR